MWRGSRTASGAAPRTSPPAAPHPDLRPRTTSVKGSGSAVDAPMDDKC